MGLSLFNPIKHTPACGHPSQEGTIIMYLPVAHRLVIAKNAPVGVIARSPAPRETTRQSHFAAANPEVGSDD